VSDQNVKARVRHPGNIFAASRVHFVEHVFLSIVGDPCSKFLVITCQKWPSFTLFLLDVLTLLVLAKVPSTLWLADGQYATHQGNFYLSSLVFALVVSCL
jgi:hypothetical protein